jgi:hypothetical protein
MEIAQFVNGVIAACWNHFLTHYLASLGDIATLWRIYEHSSLSLLRSAGVQLRDSGHALPGEWLPGPKPFSRIVSNCLEQSLRSKTQRLGVSEFCCMQELRQKMNKLTSSLTLILTLWEKGTQRQHQFS